MPQPSPGAWAFGRAPASWGRVSRAPHMVHGLLQTEAYARAVLGALDRADLDNRTTSRLARQSILGKEEPPVVWAVMGGGCAASGDRRG